MLRRLLSERLEQARSRGKQLILLTESLNVSRDGAEENIEILLRHIFCDVTSSENLAGNSFIDLFHFIDVM